MAEKYVSVRNLKFLLHEVFNASQLNQYEYYKDYDVDAMNMAVDAAKDIADTYLFPIYREMDREPAKFEVGEVWVHPGLKAALQALAQGGWIAANDTFEMGGQQMPHTLLNVGLSIFYSANANAASFAFLTQSAARLIRSYGTPALNDQYVHAMYSGDWQGTMALTEPQSGSSLSDILTTATPQADGSYKIKGQKIYISGGDHTAVDNVIHLTLARIDGAPAGTRGISLFVVPKRRIEDGELVNNDITTAGIYHKMGQKGAVAAHLMYGEKDNCHGYLIGQPNKGLAHMFQMMNEARIGTGIAANGCTSAAYYASLQYAHERAQGRHPDSNSTSAPVTIIEHADVKRMLLLQKAVVEGSFSLLLECSMLADLSDVAEGDTKEQAHLLLELLTPIAKSYPAEAGIEAVSTGMQILGGAGYTDDFPLEQYYRDIRVNAIYEGTTGIHALDLLGRKITMNNGAAPKILFGKIKETIAAARQHDSLVPQANALETATKQLHQTILNLLEVAFKEGPRAYLADANLFLEYFGIVCIAWQWLKQATVAQEKLGSAAGEAERTFYESKLLCNRYFFAYELPKTLGLHKRLQDTDRITLTATAEQIV